MRTAKYKRQTSKRGKRVSDRDNSRSIEQILDISFSFLTPSLLAFRGINQQGDQQKDRKKRKHAGNENIKKKRTNRKNMSIQKKGILLQMDILGLTRWPNWGRVSRSRIGSTRTTTVKRGARVMLGGHVTGRGAEGKLGVETRGPAIAVAALVAV
jgi:hypothetical protein